ncbi:dissimilatory-type sulfite reductase subunit alpha [Acidobacteriota bacterium]
MADGNGKNLPKTPILDELETGPWPSFITEIKKAADWNDMSKDLLSQLEYSYETKIGHWKHGGIVGVMGYGGGVIGRYSAQGEKFPAVKHFHTLRINQPSGWFYTTEKLRILCDIWQEHGSGLTNMHGSTGDIIFLGTTTDQLEPVFAKLTKAGFDLGGSGSCMRTPSCCVGPARCEWSCYDTLALTYDLTQTYQDELHRPAFPYKFKFKMAGCANDCVASIARADMSIIGTWRDNIRINQGAMKEYADKGVDIVQEVLMMCPAKCMSWDGNKMEIIDEDCTHCMHCINTLPKALKPGTDTGATLLLGSKAPILEGAMLSSVIVPFIKLEPPYEELKDLVSRIWDFWDEHGKNRERVGELALRVGWGNFLEEIGVEPIPQMIREPRANPYIFYEEYYEDDDEEEEG